MADGINIDHIEGHNSQRLGSELIGSSQVLRAKMMLGDSGTDGGNVSSTNPFPVALTSPNGVFGEVITAELTPVVQIANQYQLDPDGRDDIEVFEATGGSGDNSGNLFRCQSGTSVGGYGVVRSRDAAIYRAGEGIEGLFTASFTTGVALSLQFGGLFSLTETLGFGYDGEDFSVIYSRNGAAEVQSIQVTGAASGSESATVTLDGDAFTANLTNDTVQVNAFEIARDGAADGTVGAKWRFEQIDDTVYAIARSVGDKTGTMSFSSATATASVSELTAGVAKTDAHVAQASWNVSTSPFASFDATKLNLYRIQFGYLGIANIDFSVYNPDTGQFVHVHRIKSASASAATSLGSPDLKVGWTSASLGSSGTNLIVTGGSAKMHVQGKRSDQGSAFAAENTVAAVGTSLVNILTIKNRIIYGNRFNLGKILMLSASLDNEANKGAVVELLVNATVGGSPNFQYQDSVNSLAAVDKTGTTVTGGTLIAAFTVDTGGGKTFNLADIQKTLNPEDTLTLAAKVISGAGGTMTGTLVWKEEK